MEMIDTREVRVHSVTQLLKEANIHSRDGNDTAVRLCSCEI